LILLLHFSHTTPTTPAVDVHNPARTTPANTLKTTTMGAFYETIPENIQEWILLQKMLWVATAPLSAKGHINVSPKGGESFGLIDEKTFWYHEVRLDHRRHAAEFETMRRALLAGLNSIFTSHGQSHG
jgi:hypothetical protein